MRKFALRLSVAALLVMGLLTIALPASAHERRTVGDYQTVVGWATEPVYTGFPNAVQLILSDKDGKPVVDLGADDLKVEVSFGNQKTAPLALEPAFKVGSFGEPGDYHADLIPTRAGEYSFHITGTVKGQAFDQTYKSGEDTFESPGNPAELEFPSKDPSNADLAESISALRAERTDTKKGGSSNAAPLTLSIVALALSVVALGASRKKKSS